MPLPALDSAYGRGRDTARCRPAGGVCFSTPASLQSLGDLLDVFGVYGRGVEGRGRVKVGDRAALGDAVIDLALRAVYGREAVPDLPEFLVVLGAEAVQDAVEAPVHVLPGVGELVAVDFGHRQQLGHVDVGEVRERLGVGLLVDTAAHDQVPDHLAGHGVLGALVDPDLAHPGTRLQEEVVEQIQLEVARVENVVSRPRFAARASGDGAKPEVGKVVGVAGHAAKIQGGYGLIGARLGLIEQHIDRVSD